MCEVSKQLNTQNLDVATYVLRVVPTTGGNLCNNHVSDRLNTDVRYFKCPTINAHIFSVRPQQRNKQTRILLRLHANENHQENGKRLTPLTRCNGIGVLQRPGCKKETEHF